jgi:hypothetical protein
VQNFYNLLPIDLWNSLRLCRIRSAIAMILRLQKSQWSSGVLRTLTSCQSTALISNHYMHCTWERLSRWDMQKLRDKSTREIRYNFHLQSEYKLDLSAHPTFPISLKSTHTARLERWWLFSEDKMSEIFSHSGVGHGKLSALNKNFNQFTFR